MTAVQRLPAALASPGVRLTALGLTQITTWGSVYYVFSLVMSHLQQTLAASRLAVVGAFSVALLVSGLLAPAVGGFIDRHGGRAVMSLGSLTAAFGLMLLGQVQTLWALYLVWALLGVAMSATLYEAAFAVATRAFASDYRRAITILTLFGGFASTVFWPLSQALIDAHGWRSAVTALGALQLLLCLPLHLWLLPQRAATAASTATTETAPAVPGPPADYTLQRALREPGFALLCAAFTANALVFSAMAVHLLAMLVGQGMTALQAAAAGALIGPMQVLGRVVEMGFGRRFTPTQVGMVAMGLLPVSLAVFALVGALPVLFLLFAFLYGSGNGAMTIVRGTVPAALFGRAHYGAVSGAMALPVLLAKASGPLLVAALWSQQANYRGTTLMLFLVAAASVTFYALALRAGRTRLQRQHSLTPG